MKIKRFAVPIAFAVFVLAFATSSMAAGPRKTTGRISGNITQSNLTVGTCAAVTDANGTDSYDTICAHSGSCKCLSVAGLALSGGFGRGTANLSVTVDENSAAVTGSDLNACAPAFGVFTLSIPATRKSAAQTQTLNAMGSVCGTAGMTNVVALGGFSVEASNASLMASGSGTFNGTINTVGGLSITVTGLITNP
jgi:hypothetical protein